MKRKRALLKCSFVLMLVVAAMHTFFIVKSGPEFPDTSEFTQMREMMKRIQFDTGGGITRSMQDIMDGFNILVSVFLFSLPAMSWLMLHEVSENKRALMKLSVINLFSVLAFSLTSLSLLAIGGTLIGGLVCVLLIISLF